MLVITRGYPERSGNPLECCESNHQDFCHGMLKTPSAEGQKGRSDHGKHCQWLGVLSWMGWPWLSYCFLFFLKPFWLLGMLVHIRKSEARLIWDGHVNIVSVATSTSEFCHCLFYFWLIDKPWQTNTRTILWDYPEGSKIRRNTAVMSRQRRWLEHTWFIFGNVLVSCEIRIRQEAESASR